MKDNLIPKLHKLHDEIFRESYYGGLANVYKPYGKDLYHYDVNSLYSFSMLKAMPGEIIGKYRGEEMK